MNSVADLVNLKLGSKGIFIKYKNTWDQDVCSDIQA